MKKLKIFIITFIVLFGIYFIFPYFIEVEIKKIPFSIVVYDENNYELWEIITEEKYRHRETKLNEILKFLKKSIISIEDRRFYWHSWIDYIGILRAIKNNILVDNIQWASTIENQIIRNNYWLNENRWYKLKIKEFILFLALNKKYSKDEILEMYLNNINFWYLNYWFESASRFYYNKSLNNLTKAEILWLITIIKNSKGQTKGIAPTKSQTTINYNLTQKIDELAKTSLKNLAWKNISDYSIIIIDRNKMDLKVMIWWNDYFSENGQVNWSLALRQPGSALKSFIYLEAFEKLQKTPSSIILDLPVSYKTSDWNSYEPKNYSLDYKWEITLSEALS